MTMDLSSWSGPPTDVLGHPVPIQQFVARTDDTVVALQHLTAFPEGCVLTLHLAVRRACLDGTTWAGVRGIYDSGDPGLPEGPTFGVHLPDGTTATTGRSAWDQPSDRPHPPVLVDAGSDSSSSDTRFVSRLQLWLWPLPPPYPFEFLVAWPALGLDLASITLDGSAVVRAARQARPFWE